MNLAELLARLADLSALTDDELIQLDADLVAAAEERADAATDAALDELDQIVAATGQVREEAANRETAATERAERARAALEQIRGPQDDGDPDDADPEPEPAADPEPAEPVAADPIPEPAADPEPLPVAASTRPRLGRTGARRPASTHPRPQPRPASGFGALGLVAAAAHGNIQAGEPIQDEGKLADAFRYAIEASAGYSGGGRVKVPIVSAPHRDNPLAIYGEDRFLDGNLRGNMAKIRRANDPEAITAAGGICVPPMPVYSQPVIGDVTRPAWDRMLTRFGADRGAVTTLPPPILPEVEGAVGQWTNDTDITPGQNVKPCLTITCPEESTDEIYAVTECLRYGNFRASFFAEQIEAWLRLTAVQHARFAETLLLTQIGTESTQVTTGQLLGTTRDVLASLDRATASFESYHRAENVQWTWGAPDWLTDMMRADLARELPGAYAERLAMADAQFAEMFARRGITPTWLFDGESGQVFGAQGDGPLQGWPSTVVTYLYPTGSWLGLDGGRFDFGIIRDRALIETNEAIQFSETLEGAHFHGVGSWRLAMDCCPDGSSSEPVSISPCDTGS